MTQGMEFTVIRTPEGREVLKSYCVKRFQSLCLRTTEFLSQGKLHWAVISVFHSQL